MVPRSCSWRRGSRPSRQASGDVCALLSAVSSPRNIAGHAVVKSWKWLDPFANFFGAIVGGFYKIPGTHGIKSLLHGTWPLGHPLHPMVTDLTIGGYTATIALDIVYVITRNAALPQAADFLIVASFLTSLASIVSGLTDWNETIDEERRTGMLHGLLRVVASAPFFVSIGLRLLGVADQLDSAVSIRLAPCPVLTLYSFLL